MVTWSRWTAEWDVGKPAGGVKSYQQGTRKPGLGRPSPSFTNLRHADDAYNQIPPKNNFKHFKVPNVVVLHSRKQAQSAARMSPFFRRFIVLRNALPFRILWTCRWRNFPVSTSFSNSVFQRCHLFCIRSGNRNTEMRCVWAWSFSGRCRSHALTSSCGWLMGGAGSDRSDDAVCLPCAAKSYSDFAGEAMACDDKPGTVGQSESPCIRGCWGALTM